MDTLRISTTALPPEQRVEVFREVFGRKILRIEIEPASAAGFEVDMTLQSLPGLGIGSGTLSPMRNRLSAELIDNDDLTFVILRRGTGTARQYGREEIVTGGQAVMTANGAPASFTAHTRTQVINLRFDRKRLASQLADANASVLQPVSRDNHALGLLSSYVRAVSTKLAAAPPDLRKIVADHIYDLAVVALGATRDAAEIAHFGGVRAARLDAALQLIRARYDDPDISPGIVAARIGISTRYLHKLLHETGSSFSERIQDLRLAKAFALLSSNGGAPRKINDAAYAAGFSDLSHFNRLFRRKYGLTPTAARGRCDAVLD